MSTVSKVTVDRERIIQNVVHAVDHHLVPNAHAVAMGIFGGNPPAQMTLEEFCAAIGRTLLQKMEAERDADMALALDEFETKEVRAMRDEAFGTKSERMRALRNGMLASYGENTLDMYGMKEAVPEVPHRLVPYAINVAQRLEKRPIVQAPRAFMPAFDSAVIAADIRVMAGDLQHGIDEVGRETREDQLARAERDVARDMSWRTYQALTTTVEGLFRLIDRNDLAERVRLTSRRRAGLPEAVDLNFDDPTAKQQPTTEPVSQTDTPQQPATDPA